MDGWWEGKEGGWCRWVDAWMDGWVEGREGRKEDRVHGWMVELTDQSPMAASSAGRRHEIGSEKAARILVPSPLCPGWSRRRRASWGAEPISGNVGKT